MKWIVELSSDNSYLEDLSKIFNTSNVRISHKENRYILESSSFDQCTDIKAIKTEADKLLIFVNGVKVLKFHSSKPITRGAIVYQDDQGHRTIHLEIETSLTVKVEVKSRIIKKDGTIIEFEPENPETEWVHLINSDPRVFRVFEIITHNFNSFIDLYKIIEIIEEDNFEPVGRKGELYMEIKRFTHTAESYEAIGKDSRHAHSKFTKPDNPMSIKDGRELVRKLLYRWLDSKVPNNRFYLKR